MKGQFTTINICGTAISAVLLVSSQFSSVRMVFCRASIRNSQYTNPVLEQPTEAYSSYAITQLESEVSEENYTNASFEKAPIQIKLPDKIIVKNAVLNENTIEASDEIGQLETRPREAKKETNEITPNENTLPDEIHTTETSSSNENIAPVPEETTTNNSDEINKVETHDSNEKTVQICVNESSIQTTETTSIETDVVDKATAETSPESTKHDESTTIEPQIANDIFKVETEETVNDKSFKAPKKLRKPRTRRPRLSKVPELEAQSPQSMTAESTIEQEFESLLKIAETNAKAGKDNQLVETQNTCTNVNTPEETSTSNGCPKNLAYYYQKPRPKQTPEECITCSKLITCVCLTSN